MLLSPRHAACLRGAEDFEGRLAKDSNQRVSGGLVQWTARRENRMTDVAELPKIRRPGQPAQVNGSRDETASLSVEDTGDQFFGVKIRVSSKRTTCAQRPEEAEE